MKKGRVGFGTSFTPHPQWLPEDPNKEKNMIKAQMKYHKEKIPADAPPFSQAVKRQRYGTFGDNQTDIGGPSLAVTRNKHTKTLPDIHDGA